MTKKLPHNCNKIFQISLESFSSATRLSANMKTSGPIADRNTRLNGNFEQAFPELASVFEVGVDNPTNMQSTIKIN